MAMAHPRLLVTKTPNRWAILLTDRETVSNHGDEAPSELLARRTRFSSQNMLSTGILDARRQIVLRLANAGTP
jgi:hypothetical protein